MLLIICSYYFKHGYINELTTIVDLHLGDSDLSAHKVIVLLEYMDLFL